MNEALEIKGYPQKKYKYVNGTFESGDKFNYYLTENYNVNCVEIKDTHDAFIVRYSDGEVTIIIKRYIMILNYKELEEKE